MADFSFRDIAHEDEADEPDMPPPEGSEDWLFWNPKLGDTRVVPGDSIDEAWVGLYYHERHDWVEWILKGREDIVADGHGNSVTSAEVSLRVTNKIADLQE